MYLFPLLKLLFFDNAFAILIKCIDDMQISAEIMQLHHSKHHQTYVTNLNVMNEKLEEAQHKGDVSSIVALQQGIKFNGGGHVNHSIFWENLAPVGKGGGDMPDGALNDMIKAQYGSLEDMQAKMTAATVAVQGSGWGWLGYDKVNNKLAIAACPNQGKLCTLVITSSTSIRYLTT